MKRVNLDEEYEVFKEKFLDTHNFEQAWKDYQDEEGLIDKSNKDFCPNCQSFGGNKDCMRCKYDR